MLKLCIFFKLLSLENEYPVEINEKNVATVNELINEQPRRNEAIAKSKAFPWKHLSGLFAIGLLFLFSRQLSPQSTEFQPDILKIKNRARLKALELLEKLQQEEMSHEERYNKLTNIVRCYIEEYYFLPATKETTEEFLNNISHHPKFSPETQNLLKKFLTNADVVKFSAYLPSETECNKAHQSAFEYILENI